MTGGSGSASSRRIRLAVIGAGTASAPHFLGLADLSSEVDVAWVVGRNEERLATLALPPGARRTTRLDDVLEDGSVQAALVLTPPSSHLAIGEQLAAAGKHLLVEKPLAIDLASAVRLVDACERHRAKLAVMLQHRLRDGARALAELALGGTMGSLVSASASVRWWRPQSYYDEPGRGTLARDGGGVLMTQAIHTLDLLLCATGMPQRVTALAGTSPAHRMECEDTVAAVLQFDGGAIATIDATTAAYPGFPERIELNFSHGSATLESGVLRAEWIDGRSLQAGEHQGSGAGANIMAFDHAPHRALLKDFLAAVREGTEPAVSGRSALRVQRLIDALMASARTGAAVAISP